MNEDKKILLMAAKVLKQHCDRVFKCDEQCIFYDGECKLTCSRPENWELTEAENDN